MPVISAAELTAMRTIEDETMSSTAVIQRYGTAADGMGGFTETWAAVGTTVADVYPMGGGQREVVVGDEITSLSRWYLTLPSTVSVTAKDRIVIDSRTFAIDFVPNDADNLSALRVEATSLNEEQAS